ncbi:MAG TPA: hypothetical protein VH092_16195 [Urbifossiella sp.]|nr:hypothetical protein [Urbifossiella sp.]
MSESDWLFCSNPQEMLSFLRDRGASERKGRLFATACGRRVSHLLVPEAREALGVAERYADGLAGPADRKRAREAAFLVGWVSDPSTAHRRGPAKAAVSEALQASGWQAADGTARRLGYAGALDLYSQNGLDWNAALALSSANLVNILRDIFGNPFAPISFSPSWRTEAVVSLASGIYEERLSERMGVLGDALEEAGCDDCTVLEHCRAAGPHQKGCWVVDLVLGKT